MAKPVKKQSWSNIDVFGLIRGLGIWDHQYRKLQYVRRPFDTSLDIKDKILRMNDNPPSLTKQGLLNGLCNEFRLTPYNLTKKTTFQLTYNPFPSGNHGVQDIFVQFRPVGSSGDWINLYPQVWGDTYEYAKSHKRGFIVWPMENYIPLSGYKNFNYAPIIEILEDLDDNQDLRITYYVAYVDEDNNKQLVQFTDMNNLSDPNDKRFTYRKPVEIDPLSGIIVFNLNDIPSNLSGRFHTADGHATEQMYIIKQYFDKMYKHTWDKVANNTTIWDIGDVHSSGEIPSFLDSYIPKNNLHCIADGIEVNTFFSGYLGGVDYLSSALYLSDLVETETVNQEWYLRVYPGRFYIDGIPYRLFEDPRICNLVFVSGVADLPSGLVRGMTTILAKSDYYNGCTDQDPYLSGFIFEDYWAPCGAGGDECWGYIYRRRPHLTANHGYQVDLELGEYSIDFESRKIYLNSLFNSGILIWDNALLPSGRIIKYDVNPLNEQLINMQKFFIYLVNKE